MNVENALIASLLIDNSKFFEVKHVVHVEYFKDSRCAECFKIFDSLNGDCDILIMSKKLRETGHADLVPWVSNILDLGIPVQINQYAKLVREDYVRRQLVNISSLMKNLPNDKTTDQIIKDYTNELSSLLGLSGKDFLDSRNIIIAYLDKLQKAKDRGSQLGGISSGYSLIDIDIDGFRPNSLTIIGARPSQGKSSLMTCMASHMAINEGKNIAIFSIESSENEIMEKMISGIANIDTKTIRQYKFNEYDRIRFDDASEKLCNANIFVNDISTIDIFTMKAQIKKLCNAGNKPDIVFIDYLQIIEVEKGNDTFANKIARVTQGLKNIAKELQIPVVVLAQINRANGEDPPRLMDLKDSGAIEAIADVVILLHRPGFYKTDSDQGVIEINIAKNRNGPLAYIKMQWIGAYTKVVQI